jgi:hypothetical protein
VHPMAFPVVSVKFPGAGAGALQLRDLALHGQTTEALGMQTLKSGGVPHEWRTPEHDEVGHLEVISDSEPSTLYVEKFDTINIAARGPGKVETGADLGGQTVPKGCWTTTALRNLGPLEAHVDVVWMRGRGPKHVIEDLRMAKTDSR